MAYKTAVYVKGRESPNYNALIFETEEEAVNYGKHLKSHLTLVRAVRAEKTDQPVTYTFDPKEGPKFIRKD